MYQESLLTITKVAVCMDAGRQGLTVNAMAISNSQSPEGLNYNTKVTKKHLAGCLEDKVFHHFPATKEVLNRKQKDQKHSRFTVPAVCLKVERE